MLEKKTAPCYTINKKKKQKPHVVMYVPVQTGSRDSQADTLSVGAIATIAESE